MNKRDRKDNLHEAMELLELAINHIEIALKGTSLKGHADAYIIGHLRSWVDAEGTYNMGIQQYIDRLDDEDEDEENEY